MIFNPFDMLGQFIINGDKKYLAQNGYDLRLDKVKKLLGRSCLASQEDISIIQREKLDFDCRKYYNLTPGNVYEVTTIETIKIPTNAVGMIFSRSSFNRNGIQILSTLFDSGFYGTPSVAIYPFFELDIKRGTRIAQIIFIEAEAYKQYNGKYQEK